MALAFGMLTVTAGVVYILWQIHLESKGFITAMLLFIGAFCGPIYLGSLLKEIDKTAAAIYLVAAAIGYVAFLVYSIKTSDKKQAELLKESMQIWDEVYALPLPDEDTIRQFKLANKIPLVPADCKTYTDAAIEKWRISEYNKRFTQKHKFVYYQK